MSEPSPVRRWRSPGLPAAPSCANRGPTVAETDGLCLGCRKVYCFPGR
ncbi:MAG: hypothetical protein M3Q10_17910 [Chloroflexota bacterium]|nr:hypothetical protein [Chloroflexota bacterium]